MIQTIISSVDANTIVVDNSSANIVTKEEVQYVVLTAAEQGPPGINSITNSILDILSTDPNNNLAIGTDGKLVAVTKLSSTNW